MNKSDNAPEYKIELDGERRLSAVRLGADGPEIPIDPSNQEYCRFLTWAAKQSAPVAATFERLEKDCIYLGQEADVEAVQRGGESVDHAGEPVDDFSEAVQDPAAA